MNRARLLKELPWGALCFAVGLGMLALAWYVRTHNAPSSLPPPPGQTLVGDAARQLHPKR